MNTLGNKIKVFRKLKGISQLDLETAIGASAGSLSRIESDEVNPTKETIKNISSALELTNFEVEYLIGSKSEAATVKEINIAREALKELYNRRGTLSYLLDERLRVIDVSDSFLKLGGFDLSFKKNLYLHFIPEILFEDKYKIKQFIDNEELYQIAYNTFLRSYNELYFMEGDEVFDKLMQVIDSIPGLRDTWDCAGRDIKRLGVRTEEYRYVTYQFKGVKVKLYYFVEPLWINDRFTVITYQPTNLLFRLFKNSGIFK